jgi:hypothetical protein
LFLIKRQLRNLEQGLKSNRFYKVGRKEEKICENYLNKPPCALADARQQTRREDFENEK